MTVFLSRQDPSRFPLTEEKLKKIEEDVKKNNFKTAKNILKGFRYTECGHNFLTSCPDRAVRFLPIMYRAQENSAFKPELIKAVMRMMATNRTFGSKVVPDNVIFQIADDAPMCMNKEILSLRSDTFAAMFRSGFKESNQNGSGTHEIDLTKTVSSPRAVEDFKNFLYFDQLPSGRTPQEAHDLYTLADIYLIPDLKEKAHALMKQTITYADIQKDIETFMAFAEGLDAKQKTEFHAELLSVELKKRNIPFSKTNDHEFTISLSECYLLEQKTDFCSLLKDYVTGMTMDPYNDCDLIHQLEFAAADTFENIVSLKIDGEVRVKILKRLLREFPNLESLSINCKNTQSENLLQVIAEKTSLTSLTFCSSWGYSSFETTLETILKLKEHVTSLVLQASSIQVCVKNDDARIKDSYEGKTENLASKIRGDFPGCSISWGSRSDHPNYSILYISSKSD